MTAAALLSRALAVREREEYATLASPYHGYNWDEARLYCSRSRNPQVDLLGGGWHWPGINLQDAALVGWPICRDCLVALYRAHQSDSGVDASR